MTLLNTLTIAGAYSNAVTVAQHRDTTQCKPTKAPRKSFSLRLPFFGFGLSRAA